jgi:GrpB-like predicted nucleotidyltransferase (UPF0157 family)
MKLLEPDEYQAAADRTVAVVTDEIASLVPGCRVEHVGSSSIPGAISKGDIDICVVVPPLDHAAVVERLVAAGYVVKADTLRTPELCMLLSPRTDLDVALQVIADGSRFEMFMRFRDALRASPELVERYNELKRQSSSLGYEGYRDAKAEFIQSVLDRENG